MKLVTLENGLRVIFEENKSLKSANVTVWTASGSRFETPENNGISHFIEHMVFKGTKDMNAFELASRADEIGAQMNAYTTKEYTCFYIKALSDKIAEGARLLFSMLREPLLDADDMNTERGVVLEEIAMYEDDPSDVCFGLLEKTLMPSHSLGMEILGTRENIEKMTAEDLRAHMLRYYVPERTVIGVSGNYDEEEILGIVSRYYGDMKNTGFAASYEKVLQKPGCAVYKKHFEQSQLILAFPAVGSDDPLRFQLQVLITILGGSSSSRLNQRIREQLGLVYSIDAWLSQAVGVGFIGVGLALTPAKADEALAESCRIIKGFAGSLTQKELDTAKQKVKSGLLMSREMPHSKLNADGYAMITRGCFTDDSEIIDSINALTLEKAKELADRYFVKDGICFAACGKVKDSGHYRKIIGENF
ncbi:MAG: insulinase family protein [Clostridia bacterium]|nr:insulinase family protein [Clostridia bacterium]